MNAIRSPYDGQEWFEQFMQAQASLQAQQFFLLFSLGQAGAVGKHDPGRALEILDCVAVDIDDVAKAADELCRVAGEISQNVRHNLTAHV